MPRACIARITPPSLRSTPSSLRWPHPAGIHFSTSPIQQAPFASLDLQGGGHQPVQSFEPQLPPASPQSGCMVYAIATAASNKPLVRKHCPRCLGRACARAAHTHTHIHTPTHTHQCEPALSTNHCAATTHPTNPPAVIKGRFLQHSRGLGVVVCCVVCECAARARVQGQGPAGSGGEGGAGNAAAAV